jgi:hypothetical protein
LDPVVFGKIVVSEALRSFQTGRKDQESLDGTGVEVKDEHG